MYNLRFTRQLYKSFSRGVWPVPLMSSRLISRGAALGGFSATTTSTIKRRCAVSRSVFVSEVCRCRWCFLCRCVLCACDLTC